MENEDMIRSYREVDGLRMDLDSLLGGESLQNCVGSEEEILGPLGATSVDDGESISPEHAITKTDHYILKLNRIFTTGHPAYTAKKLTDPEGKERILVTGMVGNNRLYFVVDPDMEDTVISSNTESFYASDFGLVGEDGALFSLDRLIIPSQSENTPSLFKFYCSEEEISDRASTAIGMAGENENIHLFCKLPNKTEEIGTLMHELGHILRYHEMKKTKNEAIFALARHHYNRAKKKLLHPERIHWERKITAADERGAWAIALTVLRKAHRLTGIHAGNPEALRTIQEYAEECLSSYDTVARHHIREKSQDEPIPMFSDSGRKAARKLHAIEAEYALSDNPEFANEPQWHLDMAKQSPETIRMVKRYLADGGHWKHDIDALIAAAEEDAKKIKNRIRGLVFEVLRFT